MANPRPDEEFELVLGHKQMMGFFFVVVVLFAVFFSFGYTAGYQRGQDGRPALAASVEPLEEPHGEDLKLPEPLLEGAPKPSQPAARRSEAPGPPNAARDAAQAAAAEPPKTQASVKQQAQETPAKPAAAKQPSAAEVANATHIQVAALRLRADAQALVQQLQAKGYPVVLHDQSSDGWNRVLVGPFPNADAAKLYKERLNKDGFDTIVRKR